MLKTPKSKIQHQRNTLDDIIHDHDVEKLKIWWREPRGNHVTLKIFLHSLQRGLMSWREGLEETIIFLQETMPEERRWKAFMHEALAEALRITMDSPVPAHWSRRKTMEASLANVLQMACKYDLDEPAGMCSYSFWQAMQGVGPGKAAPLLDLQELLKLDFQKMQSMDAKTDIFRKHGGWYCLWLRQGIERDVFERHLDSREVLLAHILPGFNLLSRDAIWDYLGGFPDKASKASTLDGIKAWKALQGMGQAALEKKKLQSNLKQGRVGQRVIRRI